MQTKVCLTFKRHREYGDNSTWVFDGGSYPDSGGYSPRICNNELKRYFIIPKNIDTIEIVIAKRTFGDAYRCKFIKQKSFSYFDMSWILNPRTNKWEEYASSGNTDKMVIRSLGKINQTTGTFYVEVYYDE